MLLNQFKDTVGNLSSLQFMDIRTEREKKEFVTWYTRVVQKVLQMLSFHRYKHLILAKFIMLE